MSPNLDARAAPTPATRRAARRLRRALDQGERLQALCAGPDAELALRRDRVSRWSVGQHVEHLALTGEAVLDALDRALADGAGGGGPRLSGWLVLITGHIPRGVAQTKPEWSPERTDPGRARERFTAFRRRLAVLEPRLAEIAAARGTTRHPLLGGFTASRWVRFLAIHQAHHLAIIDDVRRAAARGDR